MARLIVEELETLRTVEQKIPKPKCLNYDRMTRYGYLEVPNGAVSFIYYSGESDKNLVFINGGPGMSSQVQNFLEVGPFASRWNQFSNLLFLDLPAGTGYGRTNATAPLSYESVAIDYEYAMKGFTTLCNITYNDVVLFSTDFGARFALSIASRVKLKSLALLDPFVDTLSIVAEIPTYAFHFGVIDGQELQYFERAIIQLSEKVYVGDYRYQNGYFLQKLYISTGNVSLYNVLSQKQYYVDEDILENALNDPDSFYYIPFETEFVARSKVVFDLFRDVYFEPKSDSLEKLLSHMNVLIYQSQFDMLIPPSATLRWLTSLEYELSDFFYQNEFIDQQRGFLKKGGYLEYLVVENCGQLMHRDNRENTTILIRDYLDSII